MRGLAQGPRQSRPAAICQWGPCRQTERRRTNTALLRLPHIHPPSHRGAVVIGLEPRRTDAVRGELLVAILGISGDADRADHLALRVADQPEFGTV